MTGRRIAEGFPNNVDSVIVMLDAENAYKRLADQDIDIFWGAYIGTPDEILISGKLKEVVDDIERVRAEARKANGWIMDTYLMRKAEGGQT
jgi:precorrin-6A synthase